jgi:hypothetical protein
MRPSRYIAGLVRRVPASAVVSTTTSSSRVMLAAASETQPATMRAPFSRGILLERLAEMTQPGLSQVTATPGRSTRLPFPLMYTPPPSIRTDTGTTHRVSKSPSPQRSSAQVVLEHQDRVRVGAACLPRIEAARYRARGPRCHGEESEEGEEPGDRAWECGRPWGSKHQRLTAGSR